jgi:hypothetical protein
MIRKLDYTLCRTRHNTPLVTLDSTLGNGQEIEPNTLRGLAQAPLIPDMNLLDLVIPMSL